MTQKTKLILITGIAVAAMVAIAFPTFATDNDNINQSGSNNNAVIGDDNYVGNTGGGVNGAFISNKAEGGHGGLAIVDADGGDAFQTQKQSLQAKTGDQVVKITDVKQHRVVHSAAPTFLTSSSGDDNCAGSLGGGVGTGIVNLSLSGTHEQPNCVLFKLSKRFESLGLDDAAVKILCKNKDAKEVMPRGICGGIEATVASGRSEENSSSSGFPDGLPDRLRNR